MVIEIYLVIVIWLLVISLLSLSAILNSEGFLFVQIFKLWIKMRRCVVFFRSLSFLILFACSLSFVSSFVYRLSSIVHAIFIQDIESLDSTLEVQKDGSIQVADTLVYSGYNVDNTRQWLIRSTQIADLTVAQGERQLSASEFSTSVAEGKTLINWTSPGGDERWVIKYRQNGLISGGKDADKLFRITFDGDQNAFIRSVKQTLILPDLADVSKYSQRVFAAHGAQNAKAEVQDEKTVVFSATDVQPSANFTIIASWKKGVVQFPPLLALRYTLQYLDWWWWIGLGLILPLLSYFGMAALANKRGAKALFAKTPEVGYAEPPSALSPVQVSILYRHRLGAKALAATLINLAHRGYLQIIERAEQFTLGLRKPVADLAGFERDFLDELFADQTTISSSDIALKRQAGKALYSKRMTQIYENLYRQSVAAGLYLEDPSRVRLKFFGIGLLIFFVGLLLFIPGLSIFGYIIFLPFTLLGAVIAGMVVIARSNLPTQRSAKGLEELSKWRGFAWWMKQYRPAGTEAIFQEVMMKNLPYALVMDSGEEWAKNFENLPFYLPKWFVTELPLRSTTDFYHKIVATAETVARTVDPSLR